MPCGHGGVYCMDNHRFDLHSHSTFSDGADTPTEVVTAASNANVRLLAYVSFEKVEKPHFNLRNPL